MIYFMQDSGNLNIKIGYAVSDEVIAAEKRRRKLQTGNSDRLIVLATMPGGESDEDRLHGQFDEHRVGGEWFRPVPAILAMIADAAFQNHPAIKADLMRKMNDMYRAHREKNHRYRFYLAGKMSSAIDESGRLSDCWRETIVANPEADGVGRAIISPKDPLSLYSLPTLEQVIDGRHDYSGPYYFAPAGLRHAGDGDHGVIGLGGNADDSRGAAGVRDAVRKLCLNAIKNTDIVFAWLDRPDCHGTLAEIGYAHAVGRRIWIATPNCGSFTAWPSGRVSTRSRRRRRSRRR